MLSVFLDCLLFDFMSDTAVDVVRMIEAQIIFLSALHNIFANAVVRYALEKVCEEVFVYLEKEEARIALKIKVFELSAK